MLSHQSSVFPADPPSHSHGGYWCSLSNVWIVFVSPQCIHWVHVSFKVMCPLWVVGTSVFCIGCDDSRWCKTSTYISTWWPGTKYKNVSQCINSSTTSNSAPGLPPSPAIFSSTLVTFNISW